MTKPDFARILRRTATPAESLLWGALRNRRIGYKFRRQRPIGPYVADFVCIEARLVVEVDGSQHAESAHDRERDTWLARRGWLVIRFWNQEVVNNLEGVVTAIRRAADDRSSSPT